MSLLLTRVVDAATIGQIVAKTGLPALYDMVIERLTSIGVSSGIDQRRRDGFLLTTPHDGLLEWMPAVRHGRTVSVKLVGYNPHNPAAYQLPTVLSTICAFDVATGHLRTLVDGTFVTAVRTGAASAVASRILADPESRVLGLVGCGAQAVTQLHALTRVFSFTEVLIYDEDSAAVRSFAKRARFAGDTVRSVGLAELQRRADIICTATSVLPRRGPVLPGDQLRPAVHVNAVGADMPGKTELPMSLLREATVCPDDLEQARHEGECQRLTDDEIGPSLTDLLRDPDRYAHLRGSRTVYDSTGLAVQDLLMIELVEELADAYGLGNWVALEASGGDARDPYAFLDAELAEAV